MNLIVFLVTIGMLLVVDYLKNGTQSILVSCYNKLKLCGSDEPCVANEGETLESRIAAALGIQEDIQKGERQSAAVELTKKIKVLLQMADKKWNQKSSGS